MRTPIVGPRLLLRRLREVMSEPSHAQTRLDRIVVLIAGNMVAEVCSVYVLRADNTLELYATEGLNREAVHLTTMRMGEGLVGWIAREGQPLALSDAQHHPAFSYKPETGEEIYASFLGAPILRGGNIIGVLVVQNRTARVYTEEEIEALQTTAMVLAEMIAGRELEALARPESGGTVVRRSVSMRGAPLSEGVGLGHVVLHEPRVEIKNLLADDPEQELLRLNKALAQVQANLDDLMDAGGFAQQVGEHKDVLETFRMFAQDRGWIKKMQEAIGTGLTAEAAVERVQLDLRTRMLRQSDPYLRERLHDLDDLANRLLHQLTGTAFTLAADHLPENAILVARSMGPAALLEYQRLRLRGLVLEEGGATSHVAIVARALGIPAIGQVEGITHLVEVGDAVILDGGSGDLHLRPQADMRSAYGEKARLRARKREQYRALRDLPSQSLDGVDVRLQMNAGLLVDLPNLEETAAAGIGLFRTEILFMVAPSMPSLKSQQELYSTILDIAESRPVTFRTLDIGGDKILPYLHKIEEENPALGWRAIRIGLDRPALLRMQFRALLGAASGRELRIMLPMISTIEEFDAAKAMLEREQGRSLRLGHSAPHHIKLGAMLEVPSLLFDLPRLLERVDFLSIGSNDLMQFLFAVDRENIQVASRFDVLHPAFLRALALVAQEANKAGKEVSICGEIAGRPTEVMALLGLGFRCFSMSPLHIGPIKALVRGLDISALSQMMAERLRVGYEVGRLRVELSALAASHHVLF